MDALTRREEWKLAWRVPIGASIGLACGSAAIHFTSSLFIPALQDTFGWSRTQVSAGALGSVIAAITGPLIGRLADRFGARRIVMAALVVQGVLLLSLAAMPASRPVYYGLYLMLLVAMYGTSGVTFARAVTSWFVNARGLALGISRIGAAAAGAILPPILFVILHAYGVRGGYLFLALLALLIGLPVCWLFVYERPGDARPDTEPFLLSLRAILREPKLPVMLLSIILGMPAVGIIGHLQPILLDKGLPGQTSAYLVSLYSVCSFMGIAGGGYLLDRIRAPIIGAAIMVLAAAGVAVLCINPFRLALATIAVIMIGLSQGTEIDLIGYLVSRYFNRSRFSFVYGVVAAVFFVTSGVGIALFGWGFDEFGTYRPILLTSIAVLLLRGCTFGFFGPYSEHS
jgi:MFS family permease